MSTHNLCFEQKYEKYPIFFLSENFMFFEVKFSLYLKRPVFVMEYAQIAQIAQIQITLRMRKISSGPLLSIYTICSIQRICKRKVKALIRLRGCICPQTRFRMARPISYRSVFRT